MPPVHLVLERFTPIIESIEWKVGHRYWQVRGTRAFTSNEVPHMVTNDGVRAARAADVLYASCQAAAAAGTLEEEIQVAELAVGLGMHARLLLDRFQARCQADGVDYYDRLTFYVTDWSARTLQDLVARGTLPAHHEGRVRMGLLNALAPDELVDLSTGDKTPLKGLRAIIHNYLLAVLPFDLLVHQGDQWLQVQVQTRIDDTQVAAMVSEVPLDQLGALVKGDDDAALDRLVPLYELFCMERAFFPIDIADVPGREELERFHNDVVKPWAKAHPDHAGQVRVLHSRGALNSLRASLPVLREDGFVLLSDYGWTKLEDLLTVKQHQRFGPATAMGLNFCFLDAQVAADGARVQIPSDDDEASIRARLISRNELPETEAAFHESYATRPLNTLYGITSAAAEAQKRGDVVTASARFAEAHRKFPESWHVLAEAARHATFYARNPQLGLELAARARSINPTASAQVHNEVGDALYELGRKEEAHDAYQAAIQVDPDHPRAYMNLSWTLADQGNFDGALEALGKGLALDIWGMFTGPLLEKQKQVLQARAAVQQRKQSWFQSRQW